MRFNLNLIISLSLARTEPYREISCARSRQWLQKDITSVGSTHTVDKDTTNIMVYKSAGPKSIDEQGLPERAM
ncbi:hypothetical protein YA52_00265 [Enterobacter roggenkampii]|nr:hypothetical protein YA52_00265 [Enterobacter roggenkampii]